MTDWREDLLNLLTATDEDPVEDILRSAPAQPVIGALTSAPADFLFKTLDAPASVVRGGIGAGINLAQGEGTGGIEQGQQQWNQSIQGLRESDRFPGLLKTPVELALNVGLDPLTWTGIGAAGKAARGLRTAANVATIADRPLVGTALRGAATGLQAAQIVNDAPGRLGLPVIQAGTRQVGRGIERIKPGALATSERSLRMQRDEELRNIATRMRESDPSTTPPLMPRVAPITSSPQPPTFPNIHPTGSAPSTLMEQTRVAARAIWDDLRNPSVGITPGARGEGSPPWATPGDVRLEPRHLDNMATVGAGIMQTITDSGGLMPGLIRSSDGMQQLQRAIVEEYGAGIQPYLPRIYDRMRKKFAADNLDPDAMMPSSRFLLPQGWANGFVNARRLTDPQELIRSGRITREEALRGIADVGVTREGDPDVVEAAATMGAAFLTNMPEAGDEIVKELVPGGAWFPTETTASGAKALIPKSFREAVWQDMGQGPLKMSHALASKQLQAIGAPQPFGTTREAWNTYMRSQFGDLADDELDVLAEMSVDVMYNAYVSAANKVSGNSKGAVSLIGGDFSKLRTSHHTKIGALARGEHEIGGEAAQAILRSVDDPARRTEIADWYEPFSKAEEKGIYWDRAGKTPQPVIWGEQLRQLAGLETMPTAADISSIMGKKRALNANSIKAAITKLGGTPIVMKNPVGGLMPNLTKLVDILHTGAPLTVSPLSKNASDWYSAVAKEIEAIVGVGNYEDATFLLDVIGVTSASTEVGLNAELALRALAEWKFGSDETLRTQFGMSGMDFDTIRNGGLLTADMMPTHRNGIERAVTEYMRRREHPNTVPNAVNRGYKTFDYSSSFLANIWRDQFEKTLGKGSAARKAFDKALSIFTVDRHMSRVDFGPTDVAPIDYILSRERGSLAGKVAGLSGEEAQAAGWYWARDRQGFLREVRPESDLVFALRQRIEQAWDQGATTSDPRAWDDVMRQTADQLGYDLADPEQATKVAHEVYNLVREDIFYRHLKLSFANPKVRAELREAGLPDSLPEMQKDIIATAKRGSFGLAPEEMPFYFQDPADMGENLSTTDLERIRQLNVGKAEADVTNTDTLFDRKVKDPVMTAYADDSLKQGVKAATGETIDPMDPGWPDRIAAKNMGYDPKLTLQDNQLLATKLKSGQTYRKFIEKEALAARKTISALREANISWGDYATPDERLKAVEGNAALTKMVEHWNGRGIDVLAAGDENQAAVHLLTQAIDKEEGVKHARSSVYDLFKGAWGEQALLSGKYHTGNFQGAWFQNALAGVFTNPLATGREMWQAFKAIRGGSDQIAKDEALASLKGTQIAQSWGLDSMPVEVMRGGIRAMTMGENIAGGSAVGELTQRVTRSEWLGHKVGWVFTANNDLALALDTAFRSPLWGGTLNDAMWRDMVPWEAEVRRRGANNPDFAFSMIDGVNAPPSMEPGALKKHLMGLGLQDGIAENLMRSFVEIRGKNLKVAKAELDRVQFYGSRTNLDEWVGKIVPFHYWYSRALRYYGEEAIRNPYLLLNYMRASDGIEDAQNDPGLSARQKGFLKLFSTALGFSLLMNPDAVFGVVRVFGLQDTYDPDGQTELGGALDWLKQRGMGLYPWIDGTINLMGLYGNTFEPDLLGIRHKALVGSAVQFVRASLGFDPASAPYANAMGQARYGVSSFVSGVLPWLAEPVTPRTGGSSQEANLDTLIESVVIEQAKASGQQLTNEDLLGIMSDPDSPEYTDAYRTVADAGLVQQLLNFVAPVQFRMRHDATDVRRSQISVVEEEAKAKGIPPWEVAPTEADLTFYARYKALTGKDYQPGDYSTAKLEHDLSRAPLEAKPFIVSEAAYNELGTDQQRKHYNAYMDLLNGNNPLSAGMSDAGRQELARQYLDRHHGAQKAVDEIFAQRDAFATAHPEFAEFKAWQSRMYDLSDQLGGNLAEYRRQASQQNPNAARYFQDQEAWIHQNNPSATPEEFARLLDRATANAAAFHAITGKGVIRSIPGPFPGVPPADITLPNMLPPGEAQGSYGGNDWSRELASLGQRAGVRSYL